MPDAISRRPDLMTDNDDKVTLLYYLMTAAPNQLKEDLDEQPYLGHAVQEIALDTALHAPDEAQVNYALTLLALSRGRSFKKPGGKLG